MRFRYASLGSLVSLTAGQTYVVASANPNQDAYVAMTSFTTIPQINFVQGRYSGGGGVPQFPGNVDLLGDPSVFGANFLVQPNVPEPNLVLLVGIGLVGLVRNRKRVS